jgi:hypothetical protein
MHCLSIHQRVPPFGSNAFTRLQLVFVSFLSLSIFNVTKDQFAWLALCDKTQGKQGVTAESAHLSVWAHMRMVGYTQVIVWVSLTVGPRARGPIFHREVRGFRFNLCIRGRFVSEKQYVHFPRALDAKPVDMQDTLVQLQRLRLLSPTHTWG